MRYTVVWKPKAERQLATIWTDATNRNSVTIAANAIDELLKTQPESVGESRGSNSRIVVLEPLVVHFEIIEDDRKVRVLWVNKSPRT